MRFASPDIQFELDGHPHPYTLRFGVESLAVLQDHWQLGNLNAVMLKVATMDGGELVKDDYVAIMWAALRTHHPELSQTDAAAILDFLGLHNLTVLLSKSAGAAFSGEGGGEGATANPRPGP